MKLNKLFTGKKTPSNVGTDGEKDNKNVELVNKTYLQFPKLEGEPTYELDKKLTVGSETGDVILNDSSVAPRHCTFTHVQDVISIMDHGGQEGTSINKKAIGPGKVLILQENDKIKIGNLDARIIVQEVEVAKEVEEVEEIEEDEEIEEIPDLENLDSLEDSSDDLVIEEDKELTSTALEVDEEPITVDDIEEELELEPEEEKKSKLSLITNLFKKKNKTDQEVSEQVNIDDKDLEILPDDPPEVVEEKTRRIMRATGAKKQKLNIKKSSSVGASNSLVRVLALMIEIIAIIFTLYLTQDNQQLQKVFKDYPPKIIKFVDKQYEVLIKPYYDQYAKTHIEKTLKEIPALEKSFNEFKELVAEHPYILHGLYLFIILRLMTSLLFGLSFGQFLVGLKSSGQFLLKRVKGLMREFIGLFTFPFIIFDLPALFSKRTFKEVLTVSNIETRSTVLSSVLTSFWLVLFSTLYFGLPIFNNNGLPENTEVRIGAFNQSSLNVLKQVKSKDLRLTGKLLEDTYVYPRFVLKKKDKKTIIQARYIILNIKSGQSITISRLKDFSMLKLLKSGIEGNYLAQWKYPEIINVTHDVAGKSKNFKSNEQLNIKKIGPELLNLLNASYNLKYESLYKHIIKNGPFLEGYIRFSENLNSLVGKKINLISTEVIGGNTFLVFKGLSKKSFIVIPIDQKHSSVYEIKVGKNPKIYMSILENMLFAQKIEKDKSLDNIFSVTDHLISFKNLNVEQIQRIYEFFYNEAKKILLTNDEFLLKPFIDSIQSILEMVKLIDHPDKDKFIKNMTDLLNALQNKNKKFFGIQEVKTADLNRNIR